MNSTLFSNVKGDIFGGVTAVVIALPLALAIVVFWPRQLARFLPAPLAALVVGTGLGVTVFSGAPIIGEVPTGLPEIHLPTVSLGNLAGIVQPALILALLGSIDSLLTSLVADSITRTRHNSNRELIGQGVGNMVAGLIGGLPGAGATMRTVVNVRAGGATPFFGALLAVILLALVLGLGPLAERIPHAVLAGILMKVGWDIIDWGYLKPIRRAPRDKVVVMLVALGLTVFVDLITAVAVGLILAGFVSSKWREEDELAGLTAVDTNVDGHGLTDDEHDALVAAGGDIGPIRLRGSFSYASARELVQRTGTASARYKVVILDFEDVQFVDTSAALAIEELVDTITGEGRACYLAGLQGKAEKTLAALQILDKVPDGNRFAALTDAIGAARAELPPVLQEAC